MKTLRPYQRAAIDTIYTYWQSPKPGNGLIVCPTGAGKSLIMAAFIKELCDRWPGTRILVLTHVKELVEQDEQELLDYWPGAPVGVFSAGMKRKEFQAQVLFATIQSLDKHCHKLFPVPEIVIVDEAHLIPRNDSTRYKRTLTTLKQMYPHLKCIGLSATPYRLDSGFLYLGADAIFNSIIYDIPIQSLIDQGYLCNLTIKSGAVSIDTRDVHHSGKEFIAGELEHKAMEGDTTSKAIADLCARGKDRKKWLVFACGVKHCKQIKNELDKHSISCEIITGETDNKSRDSILDIYKNGGLYDIQCIVNCNVLTTGFNNPNIDLIAMLRPTESAGLYVQMVGRGSRTASGKENCLILDYAGNAFRHGPIDSINPERKPGDGDGIAPCKECPECGSIIHAAMRVCPDCGHEFPPVELKINHKPVEAPVLKAQLEPECIEVKSAIYSVHKKQGKSDSVKITYKHGFFEEVSEWIFPAASTQAGIFYYEKFCKAIGLEPPYPRTAQAFIDRKEAHVIPRKIWIVPDGRFTRVVNREYISKYELDEIPF